MAPTPELIAQLYREEVACSANGNRRKARAGADLLDYVCERMRGGIGAQFPDMSSEQVEAELMRRLTIARRLEDAA